MAKTLDETDVGITCYISSLPGFRGILKQRYADFIVNEVDCDGKIVHLTSFDLPPENAEEREDKIPDWNERIYTEEIESFRSLTGEADAELLTGLLVRIASGVDSDANSIVLSPDADKSHRADVHNFFKKNFKFLITDTVEELKGNVKCIRVRFSSEEGGHGGRGSKKRKDRGNKGPKDDRPFDSRGSDSWPEHLGKFLRFHLYKENKDTQEALGVIGKMLGIQQRSFGFAGTKDKRSISTQRVTMFKQHAKRLAALNSRLIGIKVGDFCYVREGLVLGQLLGNRFTIILRGVIADSEDTIKAAADGLGKNGFINYYGLQRFGSGSVPTHLVGAALLRGEWRVAVGLILDPRDGERPAVREAREYYKETGDIDGTVRRFPRHLVAERSILQCLKKCPGNYLQALKAIPRTLRMMYVHSYQSYLWNHAASMRVQKYGIGDVVLGDLVYCKVDSFEKLVDIDGGEPEDDSYNDAHNYGSAAECSESLLLEEKVHHVKVINADDLLKGCYTFGDVVLPLPGSRVVYPENDVTHLYHELAEKDTIKLTESTHSAKEFSITSMTGGYRRVFQRPIDFAWELLSYTDSTRPLTETDLDIISKANPLDKFKEEFSIYPENAENNTRSCVGGSEAQDDIGGRISQNEVEPDCNSDPQSSQMALKLGFTLPPSCYATMAIRELLKTSTSVAFQKTLNN